MEPQRIWQRVLEDVEISVSAAQYSSFIKTLNLSAMQTVGDRLLIDLDCPSNYHRTTVEQRYYGQLKEAFDRITQQQSELRFNINAALRPARDAGPLFANTQQTQIDAIELARHRIGLRDDYILKTFAVSGSNEMAHAAAIAVTEHFGKAYNPLFLYGGVGVGKTHLMQAIANIVLETDPQTAMIYCAGEQFTNEIIDAIQQKNTREFKRRYRHVKGLFIDDIQFIAGKTTVQEEFFHTFNAILQAGGQVVMTSDRPPQDIRMLEDRLRSRFEAGLIVDIGQPDFELRSAITMIKAEQRGIKLTHEGAQLIAGNIESARAIEGFLVRLMTESKLKSQPVTDELVKSLLNSTSTLKDDALPPRRPMEIIKGVATYFHLSPKDLKGPGRKQTLVTPRHIAMYILRIDYQLPLTEVGDLFSGRDHTTVIHAVDKITEQLKDSEALRLDMANIRKSLYKSG
jgi:chromosomal replication initiator protein